MRVFYSVVEALVSPMICIRRQGLDRLDVAAKLVRHDDTRLAELLDQPGKEAFGGLDPGYKDPTAYVVIVYDMGRDLFHIVAEYLASEATTPAHAARIKEMNQRWGVDMIFIDSAAAQFAADLAYNHDLSTTRAKKDVLPGLAYVQSLIESGRLLVDPSCENVLAMFDQYRWDDGNKDKSSKTIVKEKPVHDQYSHMADAVRYALYTYTI